jgi:sulfate permease, SulP family
LALVDTTGAASLVELSEEMAERGIIVAIAAAKMPVRHIRDRTGVTEQIGSGRHYPSVAAAVESLLQM